MQYTVYSEHADWLTCQNDWTAISDPPVLQYHDTWTRFIYWSFLTVNLIWIKICSVTIVWELLLAKFPVFGHLYNLCIWCRHTRSCGKCVCVPRSCVHCSSLTCNTYGKLKPYLLINAQWAIHAVLLIDLRFLQQTIFSVTKQPALLCTSLSIFAAQFY